MSVQLIVFPQYFDGSTPLSSPSNQFIVDGINFNQVNTSSSTQSVSGTLPQTFINSYTYFGFPLFIVNTWYRFSGVASEITQSTGSLAIPINTGIVQRLSNLTYGATYDLTLNINSNTTQFTVYQYKVNQLISSHVITGTGTQTISFNAYSTADIIVIYSATSVVGIADLSCVLSTSTPSGVFTDLSNGQVICDLYEDEDIPLSLSVDDFKNVAEKVQSYSKAFKLPATKRNNQIFDNIFEITRTDTGLNFNPYKRTKAILKQDGFLLFEGYLRMLDISDKSGETSYNVNLYSEVVALSDVLGDKNFSELDFNELNHDYNKTNITRSWNDTGSSITYTNPDTSGFRDDYTTLRYPFVDWTHQILVGGTGTGTAATLGNPELTSLETAFRPFINIKYLIDRIFQAVPFTYESEFFDTEDFKKLYMDFNWGADASPTAASQVFNATWKFGTGASSNIGTGSYKELRLIPENITGGVVGSTVPPNYDTSTYVITATTDNELYNIQYGFSLENTGASNQYIECRWIHTTAAGLVNEINLNNSLFLNAGSPNIYLGTLQVSLETGDTLKAQFNGDSDIRQKETGSSFAIFALSNSTTTSETLNTLRGELGQWEFLKGIITMFNLVTLPDEDNPSNIKIEPYTDVFIPTGTAGDTLADRGITHDWTDKIDVSEMKLIPLTDLNKKTIFKFVEDEDDYAFMNYKKQVGGHLYGSKKYDASEFTILAGEDEIIAEPFAATVVKPLMSQFPDFITPSLYSMSEDEVTEGFDNSPRIMYNNGIKTISGDYYIPAQNGGTSATPNTFLQFSHLTDVPTIQATSTTAGSRDFHFGECQLLSAVGSPVNDNLFNLYWLPYYSELYNSDTRIMTIKVNLSPSDINTFKFNDTVFIKNRTFRVNKIDYKPNDLATVEFILIP
jgi:hypothetical protein